MAFIKGKEVFFFPFGSEGGGIIESDELPTENIKTDSLYKTPDGLFWYDTEWHRVIDDNDIVEPGTNSSNPLGTAGLLRMYNDSSGVRLDEQKRLCIAAASTGEIHTGVSVNKPIVPATIKYALQDKSYKGTFENLNGVDGQLPASSQAVKTLVDSRDNALKTLITDGDSAVKDYVLQNLMHFKMDYLEKGQSFTLKPGMVALIMPYGDYTLSLHNGSTTVVSGMGTTMIFAAERDSKNWNGDYWLAAVHVKRGTLGTPTVGSTHNKYSSNLTIKNNYSGSDGSGRAYVYYLSNY